MIARDLVIGNLNAYRGSTRMINADGRGSRGLTAQFLKRSGGVDKMLDA